MEPDTLPTHALALAALISMTQIIKVLRPGARNLEKLVQFSPCYF